MGFQGFPGVSWTALPRRKAEKCRVFSFCRAQEPSRTSPGPRLRAVKPAPSRLMPPAFAALGAVFPQARPLIAKI
jgi:hypothetical protein